MGVQTKYGIRPATIAVRDLLVVPHNGRDLKLAYPVFGPSTSVNNGAEMAKTYAHSPEIPSSSF
jgi:hypothetical protein